MGLLAAAIAVGLAALGAGIGNGLSYHVQLKVLLVNQKLMVCFKLQCLSGLR